MCLSSLGFDELLEAVSVRRLPNSESFLPLFLEIYIFSETHPFFSTSGAPWARVRALGIVP